MKNKNKNHEQSQLHNRLSRFHGRGLDHLAFMPSCSVEKQISISTITIEFLVLFFVTIITVNNKITKFWKMILNQEPIIFWACTNKHIKICNSLPKI